MIVLKKNLRALFWKKRPYFFFSVFFLTSKRTQTRDNFLFFFRCFFVASLPTAPPPHHVSPATTNKTKEMSGRPTPRSASAPTAAPAPATRDLELTIDSPPHTFFLSCSPSQSVDDLRAKVAAKLSFPTDEMELKVEDGRLLADGKALEWYDLPQNCRILPRKKKKKVSGEVSDDDAIASLAELKGKCKGVDICFAFDTTGSMGAVIKEVRKKVRETCQRLMGDIPGIRISIMGVGDMCDQMSAYVVHTLNFSTKTKEIENFVQEVGVTYGGDPPECYEWALHKANRLSWRADPGIAKAFVLIGDAVPHPPSYSSAHCSWQEELGILADKGVKIYAVQANPCPSSLPFYARLAERSGGLHFTLKSFDLITRMFLAVCYREAGRLGEYEAEGRRGARGAEMGEILDNLARPNEKMAEKSKIVCYELWFTETVQGAKGKCPSYFYDPTRDMFFCYSAKYGKYVDSKKYSVGMEEEIDEQFRVRKWADLMTDKDTVVCKSAKKTAPKAKAAAPKAKTPPPPKRKSAVKRKRVASEETVAISKKRAKKEEEEDDQVTERDERMRKRREREEKGEDLKRTYYWSY